MNKFRLTCFLYTGYALQWASTDFQKIISATSIVVKMILLHLRNRTIQLGTTYSFCWVLWKGKYAAKKMFYCLRSEEHFEVIWKTRHKNLGHLYYWWHWLLYARNFIFVQSKNHCEHTKVNFPDHQGCIKLKLMELLPPLIVQIK